MRLALAVGRLDVDQLMRELDSRQVAEWSAFEEIEGGLGDRAVRYAAAQIAALLAEAHRDPKRRPRPFAAADFLPFVERPELTPAAFRARFANVVKKKRS